MSGRDFEAQPGGTQTRAKRAGWGARSSTHLVTPGQCSATGESAWKEARGSTSQRHPGETLEREKPKRVAVLGGSHDPIEDVDAAGGSNPLKRPGFGHEGTAFGCQGTSDWDTSSVRDPEVAVEAGSNPGSRKRGRLAERPSPSPATETLKGEPHGCCRGRQNEEPSGEARRGATRQGRRNAEGAMGRGWATRRDGDRAVSGLDPRPRSRIVPSTFVRRTLRRAGCAEGERNPMRGGAERALCAAARTELAADGRHE